MKMPTRPFYPPVTIPPDIFGLHAPPLLSGETENQRQARAASVEDGVRKAFQAAIDHLGEEEARQLFKRMLRRPKRGFGKMLSPARDAQLLRAFDEAMEAGESIASLSRRLHAHDHGRKLGSTQQLLSQLRFASYAMNVIVDKELRRRAPAFGEWRPEMSYRGF